MAKVPDLFSGESEGEQRFRCERIACFSAKGRGIEAPHQFDAALSA